MRYLNNASKEFIQAVESNGLRGYALTLELNDLDKEIKSDAKFSVADINTSYLVVQLLFDGSPLVLNSNSMVYANIKKEDSIVRNNCEILEYDLGIIALKFKTESINIQGNHKIELAIKRTADEKLISPKVSFNVYSSFEEDSIPPSEDEIGFFDELMQNLISAREETQAVNANITQAEETREAAEASREVSEQERVQDFIVIQDNVNNKIAEVNRKIQEYNTQSVISAADINNIIQQALA